MGSLQRPDGVTCFAIVLWSCACQLGGGTDNSVSFWHSDDHAMKDHLTWDPDSDSAQRAARVVALHALDSVARAYDAIRKADAESIHEFRVELRRLRSWIRAYRSCLDDTVRGRTMRSLRDIARATTTLRDLDVQIAWLRSETSALGETRLEAAKWVIKSLKSDRKIAWRRFRKILDRNYKRTEHKLCKQLTHFVERHDVRTEKASATMRPVTAALLLAEATIFSRALSRIQSADDTRHLHKARIAAKRARYVLEALDPEISLSPAVASDLARFQDIVGELRDAQLLAHRVTREITTVAAERTALVASELVYRPRGAMDFSRVVGESPFDASLSLLFARLHDRIAAASRTVSMSLAQIVARDWERLLSPEALPEKQ